MRCLDVGRCSDRDRRDAAGRSRPGQGNRLAVGELRFAEKREQRGDGPAFAKAVEEASGGTLKIEHYPGGTLGKGPVQQLSMVENAVADIAEVVVAYSPGRFPELSIFELPFLARSNVEAGLAA